MPYLNVDDEFPFHRKTVAAGNPAIGLWVRAGAWSAGAKLDGFIPAEMAKLLGTTRQVAPLLEVGLWVPGPNGGFNMHDYDDHNITSVEAAALSAKRAEAGRKGGSRRPGLQSIKGQANA